MRPTQSLGLIILTWSAMLALQVEVGHAHAKEGLLACGLGIALGAILTTWKTEPKE